MENDLKVTVLIYSGKPDPQWQLIKTQADHFLSLFNKNADTEKEAVIPSKLGYRGMRVSSREKTFLIYDGVITCMERERRLSKKDEGKIIEKYLLTTAPKKISDLLRQQSIL